jgi:nitroimidazol reductase NimA-like FMN-containing flavoprotein (pyridoxamine 5'-phosphate oxidase superfamily)
MHLLDARTGLEHLPRAECLELLEAEEVGRLAIVDGGTPHIFPVNYVLDADRIVFRTDPGTKLSKGPSSRAAFEIDHLDRASRTGWSVVAYGRLEEITRFDASTHARVVGLGVDPWAGEKQHWMQLVPDRITGRRLVADRPGR